MRDPHKLIIVDDDVSFREALVAMFRSMGYQPVAFGSALEVLNSDALDDGGCLITDLQMPGMTGFELQAALAERGCDIPVIVLTSFPDRHARERAMALGAIAVLGKPFEREEMAALIRSALAPDDAR